MFMDAIALFRVLQWEEMLMLFSGEDREYKSDEG
jgi:hypothetical protein